MHGDLAVVVAAVGVCLILAAWTIASARGAVLPLFHLDFTRVGALSFDEDFTRIDAVAEYAVAEYAVILGPQLGAEKIVQVLLGLVERGRQTDGQTQGLQV